MRLLFITHHYGGGTAAHIDDLKVLLGPYAEIDLLRPDGMGGITLEAADGTRMAAPTPDWDALADWLRARDYGRVHLHHVHGFPPDILTLVPALGLPFDITLHDFHPICPQNALATAEGEYCGEPDAAGCAACLAQRPHPWAWSIEHWRQQLGQLLRRAARVIAPSEAVAERVQRHLAGLTIDVVGHPQRRDWQGRAPGMTKVLLLGGLSRIKGWQQIERCLQDARARALPLAFELLGFAENALPVWPDAPLRILGEYQDAQLPDLAALVRADVIAFPGRIPESYSYTLDIALQLGLPIVATDIGAIAERLRARLAEHVARAPDTPAPARLLPLDASAADWNDTLLALASAPPQTLTLPPAGTPRDDYARMLMSPWNATGNARPTASPTHTPPPQRATAQPPRAVAREYPMEVLFEHGVLCGHAESRAALALRLQSLHRRDQRYGRLERLQQATRRWRQQARLERNTLTQQLAQTQSDLAQAHDQGQQLRQQLRQQLDQHTQHIDQLTQDQREARAAYALLEAQLDTARRRIGDLESSLSWRLMAPVRAIKAALRDAPQQVRRLLADGKTTACRLIYAGWLLRQEGWQGLAQRWSARRRRGVFVPTSALAWTPPAVDGPQGIPAVDPASGRAPMLAIVIVGSDAHLVSASVQSVVRLLAPSHPVEWQCVAADDGWAALRAIGEQLHAPRMLVLQAGVQLDAPALGALQDALDRLREATAAHGVARTAGIDPDAPPNAHTRWVAAPVFHGVLIDRQRLAHGPHRWLEVPHARLALPPTAAIAPRAADAAGPRVLVIDTALLRPDQDSGSVRTSAMLSLLVDLGAQVHFVSRTLEFAAPEVRALQAAGVCAWHAPYARSIEAVLEALGPTLDVVILSRLPIADDYLPTARRLAPRARLVFDTGDLHFVREARQAALARAPLLAAAARHTRARELEWVRRADLTYVVSDEELQLLHSLVPTAPTAVLTNIHAVSAPVPPYEARRGIVFVGGFRHPPNLDAVRWFAEAVWPLVHAAAPELEAQIIGSHMPASLQALARPGLRMVGHVPDLAPVLNRARVSIAPLRYGAGVKGKVNQAMAAGLPVVATSVAVEGMSLAPGQDVLVADTPEAFAQAIVRLDREPALWRTLSAGGQRNVVQDFSRARARATLARLIDTRPIDIIVPVYGQSDYVRACLESVWAHTTDTAHELIVIDDASPEPALCAWLDEQAALGRITLLRNARNVGFVGSVNRGMRLHPTRDVVLLNSDTRVPNGWLARLADAARASPRVGSVTALSNNATICSFPAYPNGSELPTGWTLEALDALCAHIGRRERIALPTAVGFCMYIPRACLQAVGVFDADAFGRGYGEENDFCMRASAAGFTHWLAGDVYVYHAGGVSFAADAAPDLLKLKAGQTLLARWPDYDATIADFIARDPTADLRARLRQAMTAQRD